MTEGEDRAWAAGLFDGEGTSTVCRNRRRVAVKMTDEESVRRFAAVMGVGKVYGPYRNEAMTRRDGHARRPVFIWLAEQEDCDQAIAILLPLVGTDKRNGMLALRERYDVKTAVLV